MIGTKRLFDNLDWLLVGFYFIFVAFGWMNIYSAIYTPGDELDLLNSSFYDSNAGKQLIWIATSLILIMIIFILDYRFFELFAPYIYALLILFLVMVPFLGVTINGSHSWFKIGSITIQPAEFAKTATSLFLAKYLSIPNTNLKKWATLKWVILLILMPMVLIVSSNETGSALVFGSFILVLYKEGLPGIFPALLIGMVAIVLLALLVEISTILIVFGIGSLVYLIFQPLYVLRKTRTYLRIIGVIGLVLALTSSLDFFVNEVLQEHQRNRIKIWLNPNFDSRGLGYQVTQSKIAIGSGGFWGKGYLQGTQTKFDFVPEQSTDFIFCTIGEEFGFVGVFFLLSFYLIFIARIFYKSNLQKIKFARIYGYCLGGILFFHFFINIGMTIGIVPIMGIPLPFFSYGGSSLWSFTILLFIFLKLDSEKNKVLNHI